MYFVLSPFRLFNMSSMACGYVEINLEHGGKFDSGSIISITIVILILLTFVHGIDSTSIDVLKCVLDLDVCLIVTTVSRSYQRSSGYLEGDVTVIIDI